MTTVQNVTRSPGRPVSPYLVLFVSVLAVSWAAPLVRFTTAHPLVVSFWRLAFSLPIIALILTSRSEWAGVWRLRRVEWIAAGSAGIILAAHFATWIGSLRYTSVAASVALVSTQPIWVAIFAMVALRERPRRHQWVGIGLAVVGAAIVGWGDWATDRAFLIGDALALAGAVLVAGYYVIGRSLRREVGLWVYVGVVYAFATLTLLFALLALDVPLIGPLERTDWLVFVALALGPMMIGHTGQNYALGYLPAYAVNLTLLGEPVGATLIAWLLPTIHETPPPAAVAGGLLILSGILLGLRRR